MGAAPNPRWSVDGVVVDVDQGGDGTWDYSVKLVEDGTTLLVEEGFASEDEALRDAMAEIPGLPDVVHLRDGARVWRPPDFEQTQYAVWWNGEDIDRVQVVLEVDDDCARQYTWEGSGDFDAESGGVEVGHWRVEMVCPDPEPSSTRLLAGAAQKIFDEFGGHSEPSLSDEEFAKHFAGVIPGAPAASNPIDEDHAFNVWLSFVAYAVVGGMQQADGLMRIHGDAIAAAAARIAAAQPVELRPLYRGLLLPPSAVSHGMVQRQRERTFESFSENRDVACWFAHRDAVISQHVVMARPDVRGYIASPPKPDPSLLLWHHRWTTAPTPDGRRFPLALAAMEIQRRGGEIDAGQFEWNMRTQSEAILQPPRKPSYRVQPLSAFDCPDVDELDARFTYPPFLARAI